MKLGDKGIGFIIPLSIFVVWILILHLTSRNKIKILSASCWTLRFCSWHCLPSSKYVPSIKHAFEARLLRCLCTASGEILSWILVNVYGKRGLADVIKLIIFEMGRLACIIQVSPKYNHNCPYKRERGKDFCDNKSRDWNNMVTSHKMQALVKGGRDNKQIPP